MSKPNNYTKHMHFKSAQISAASLSPDDMEMINAYALAPLKPEDIFAFKVSMAANEIDRDYEVFPIKTLQTFAGLFVGRTVVKDHDHRSDNQIARIYATNLVEGDIMHITKTNEVYTELIAKCYMVKTASNADLIAEIQAGIRKEVSLGCRIGKAICSVCGTDNVKRYCEHFPGKEYKGETCYFSLEDPTDAYELSFVAIPAQQHAGTVKSYGEKPCTAAEMAGLDAKHSSKTADDLGERLTVNQVQEQVQEGSVSPAICLNHEGDDNRTTVNQVQDQSQNGSAPSPTCLNPEDAAGVKQGGGGEVSSKALDDFAEKLKHMGEQLDALDNSLERMKAIVLEVMAMGASGATKALQDSPLHEDAGQGEELESRPSDHQVQGSSEPSSTDLSPGEDSSGSTSATALAGEESQEELKAKQAMARLRALELALSISNNLQNTTTKGEPME